MACTALLVGKNASYVGSTIIVRNDDADILQHPRKPFRQIIQHLFNGPFKLIVTDVHSLSTREMPWHQVCTKALKSQTSRLSCCG